MTEQEPEGVLLPIEWHVPENVVSRYATNMVVQHTEHEFIISFFEATPPLAVGSPEEQRVQLQETKSVRAECIIRIIVTAGRMQNFVQVLQGNLEAYRNKFQVSE